MSDLKLTISRSFSRKVNLGNYEMMDLFAAYSLEVPAETPEDKQHEISEALFQAASADVVKDMPKKDTVSESEFADMLVAMVHHEPMQVEDYERLSMDKKNRMNEVKKAYKRSEYVSKAKTKENELPF